MNERIQELVGKAKFMAEETINKQISKNAELDAFAEKFAELIVAECMEQIVEKGTDWIDFAPSQTGVRPEYWYMAQHIKQHFGVEE